MYIVYIFIYNVYVTVYSLTWERVREIAPWTREKGDG